MRRHAYTAMGRPVGVALGIAVLAAATGLAFALWLKHGASIFLAMAEAGLSWCF